MLKKNKKNTLNVSPISIVNEIGKLFLENHKGGVDTFYICSKDGKCEIRVSNHCANLSIWHGRENGNDDIERYSIVFEESDTFQYKNLILNRDRKSPFKIKEFVYQVSMSRVFTKEDVKIIINEIERCLNGQSKYKDMTNKLTYYKECASINQNK